MRTDLGRLLAILATGLVLLLAAAFAVPAVIDWNAYRGGIEKAATTMLGRKVRILGDIDAVLLPEPHLRVNNVTAGNAKAGGMTLTADAADIALSLQALFSGRLVADSVKLRRPSLTLDFSQPFSLREIAARDESPAFAAAVRTVDIADGRLSVFSKSGGLAETLALTNVNGSLAAGAPGEPYRFIGHVSQNGRQYDVKLSAASAQGKATKLAATAQDTASKASYQAEGLLNAGEEPSFQGALTLNIPQSAGGANGLPFDIQLKSAGTIGFPGAVLDEIALTIDAQNRPQVLTGSGTIGFGTKAASLTLQAASLDADALLSASAGQAADPGASPQDWSGFKGAAASLLWLYPEYSVTLAFEGGLVQLKGEPIESVKLHGSRNRQRWVFEEMLAALPGDTAFKLAGTLTKTQGAPQLVASVALDGKSPSRLMRWLVPAGPAGKRVHAGAFSISGLLSLSNEVAALEGVNGSLDGTPFTASLHLDKAPARRLQLALKSGNLDLTAFESGQDDAALSSEALKAAWQSGLAQLAAMLGAGPEGYDTADVDISAGAIKTSTAGAKNVAVHVKFDRDLITVSKLSAETATGLVLKGEGSLPLRGPGQGRFEGRIEAQSPQAAVQIATLAGYDRAGVSSRAAAIAPAALTISAQTSAGSALAQLSGTVGAGRVDSRVQVGAPLSEWRKGQLSAEFKISGPDGNKLLALIFPDAALAPAATLSPGTLSMSLAGVPEQLETSAALSAGPLQMQLSGTTAITQSLSFKGKAEASSLAPEQFLPLPMLALLGGEPRANLHVSANITAGPAGFEARGLRAETPGNLVTGQLTIGAPGGATFVNANLNADQLSLPSLLGYFLSGTQADAIASAVPASLSAAAPPPDLWSGRPFSLSAFHETEGKVSLNAKAMTLSDGLVLSGARLDASLENGRLAIAGLKGKVLGGEFDASLALTAKENNVAADAHISLSGAGLAQLPAQGTPAVLLGHASLSLSASGQGLSPRGLVAVLRGRGSIAVSDGQLVKLTPLAVQTSADELLAEQMPLTEEAISKKLLQAVQANNSGFRHLKIPVTVQDGILEIRRASFRGKDATVRMEAYLDLNKTQVDSTWQMGVSSDRQHKWPAVKVMLSGPLRELGAKTKTLAAEDFVRAILVRKMEGDITRLESLNKPQPAVASGWITSQEPAAKAPRRKRDQAAPAGPSTGTAKQAPAPRAPGTVPPRSFEQRMRDALDNTPGGASAR